MHPDTCSDTHSGLLQLTMTTSLVAMELAAAYQSCQARAGLGPVDVGLFAISARHLAETELVCAFQQSILQHRHHHHHHHHTTIIIIHRRRLTGCRGCQCTHRQRVDGCMHSEEKWSIYYLCIRCCWLPLWSANVRKWVLKDNLHYLWK